MTGAGRPSAPFAKKSLGQHFLADDNICRKIVAALCPQQDAAVLEIGPGRGALTRFLLGAFGRVVAVEKDRDLALALKARWPRLELVLADALDFPWERLSGLQGAGPAGVKLAGNLPYNVASPLIWDMASRAAYATGVFMVQLEVAQRLAAPPGGKAYGALGVWVQAFARVELLFKVPPQVFRPPPKVDSAVVRLSPRPSQERPEDPAGLRRVLMRCFQQRRKQLGTILRPAAEAAGQDARALLERLGIDPQARPETLSGQQFQAIARSFAHGGEEPPRDAPIAGL